MQRGSLMIVATAGLSFVLGAAASAQQVRKAERLRGGNENPPVITEGIGSFRAKLFDDRIEFRLRYDVGFGASDARQAHLHIANPGNNGGIVAFLCTNLNNTPPGATARACPASPGEVEGDIVAADVRTVTEGDPPVTIIRARDLDGLWRLFVQGSVYVNVHSMDFPAGEVRGQMSPRIR